MKITHLLVVGVTMMAAGCSNRPDIPEPTRPVRSAVNPLISPQSNGIVPEWGYVDINGPSVIRVPDWVDGKLGAYYMYFAHHRGSFIRMAFADNPEGPWTIFEGGVLDLEDTPALDHIASPDVLVDENAHLFRMVFHSVDDTTSWYQTSYPATSPDGLRFVARDEPLGPPYMRVFRTQDSWWALAKVRGGPGGVLLKGPGPDGPFEEGPRLFEGMRHAAVRALPEGVDVIFSRIGDEPERLLRTSFDPASMWAEPFDPPLTELMRPEMEYEGANLPISSSLVGESSEPVHALRDPDLFVDTDGSVWLFYAVAGENGIAVARMKNP